jgi:hypothetical protein
VYRNKEITLPDIQNFFKNSDVSVTSSFSGSALNFRLGESVADSFSRRMERLFNTNELNVVVKTRQGSNSRSTILNVMFEAAVLDKICASATPTLNGDTCKLLRRAVYDRLQQERNL